MLGTRKIENQLTETYSIINSCNRTLYFEVLVASDAFLAHAERCCSEYRKYFCMAAFSLSSFYDNQVRDLRYQPL